jgi:hypothetical protein
MKKIIAILLLSTLFFTVAAQEKNKKKLTREEKKELRRQQKEEAEKLVTAMIESRQFVLLADNIQSRQGRTFPVSSNINFVLVDSNEAVFQFGSVRLIGINGIGGITVEGKITYYDVKKYEKSGAYYIKMTISTSTGFYDIKFNISSTGVADAEVESTMAGGGFSYLGRIVPAHQSRYYKGTSF